MVRNVLILLVYTHMSARAHTHIKCELPMIIPICHTWYRCLPILFNKNSTQLDKIFKWNEYLNFFQQTHNMIGSARSFESKCGSLCSCSCWSAPH